MTNTRFPSTGIIFVVLFVLHCVGCGIKGPPVPEDSPPLPAVADLSHRLDGSTVTLAWRLSDFLSRNQTAEANFNVYQYRSALGESMCQDCPLVFEKVATVPYVDRGELRFATVLFLDSGYRYVLKVQLERNGQLGEAAESVRFDVPAGASSRSGESP